jgi:hypothetical protein
MTLDDNKLRELALEAFAASIDAHGFAVPAATAWDFMVTQVLAEDDQITEEEFEALERGAMPDSFRSAYEARIVEAMMTGFVQ